MNMKLDSYDYDLFVIGAGSGGVRASRTAANLGARVAVVTVLVVVGSVGRGPLTLASDHPLAGAKPIPVHISVPLDRLRIGRVIGRAVLAQRNPVSIVVEFGSQVSVRDKTAGRDNAHQGEGAAQLRTGSG